MAGRDESGTQRTARKPRVAGFFRVFAANAGELAKTIDKHRTDDGFWLPNPKAPEPGTRLMLEALHRETRELLCSVEVVVEKALPQQPPDLPPRMVLKTVRVEPGCTEEVRKAFERSMAAQPEGADEGLVIGIDLGTTYTCAAIVKDGEPRVIRSRLGYNTIPSMLTFDDQGKPVAGQTAERRLVLAPDEVVYGSKRIIGRTYSKGLVNQLADHMRYGIAADDEGMVTIQLGNRRISPTEVAACILAEIRKVAEAELQKPVRKVVITVPAAFTENQRSAVRVAAERAGLDLLRIVNEPTAAALAFGYGGNERKKIVVYDLGGGTFDLSILALTNSVYTVLATAGDMFLGGVDFDRVMTDLLRQQLHAQFGPNIKLDRRSEERINGAAREAKHSLSELQRTMVTLPNFRVEGAPTPTVEFNATVTREEFDSRAARLVDRTLRVCEQALEVTGLKPTDIDDVLLVGGQTRMPLVTERVEAFFKRRPSKRVHPDEVVALGAAIVATMYERADAPVLNDVLPLAIGIAEPSGAMRVVLQKNIALPTSATIELTAPAGAPLEVAVFQGDAYRAIDNEFLGAFAQRFDGGTQDERVEVTFSLSTECILRVRTVVLSTGLETEHELATRQTPDEVLARLGAERVLVSRASLKKDAAAAPPKAEPKPAPAAPPAKGGLGRFFAKLAFWRRVA